MRVELDAELNGAQATLQDISVGGARLALQKSVAPRVGDPVRLSFTLAGCGHSLHGEAVRVADDGLLSRIGIVFSSGQDHAIELLSDAIGEYGSAAAG